MESNKRITYNEWVKEVKFSKLYVHPDIKNPPNEKFVFINTKPNEYGVINTWTNDCIPQVFDTDEPPLYKRIYNEIVNIIKEYERK